MILRQCEAKTLKFVITENRLALNVAAATLRFALKESKLDAAYAFVKADTDFDKTEAAVGIVRVSLSSGDLDLSPTTYVGELEITFAADNIDRSADIEIKIKRSVFHD